MELGCSGVGQYGGTIAPAEHYIPPFMATSPPHILAAALSRSSMVKANILVLLPFHTKMH